MVVMRKLSGEVTYSTRRTFVILVDSTVLGLVRTHTSMYEVLVVGYPIVLVTSYLRSWVPSYYRNST